MKAAMKNVIIDSDTVGDYVAFAQNIDFTELFDHIKAFTKADCAFHQPEITNRRGEVHINFMSDDIAAQTGPFAAILELQPPQLQQRRLYRQGNARTRLLGKREHPVRA